jgi:hypothetical protein
MNTTRKYYRISLPTFGFLIFLFCAAAFAQQPIGAGTVTVHSALGGMIFGFDIDQNGTEGILTEAQTVSGGKTLNAIETFDQATGAIISIVKQTETKDEDVTLGIVNKSVGLIEHEHVPFLYVTARTYHLITPVSGNKLDGIWSPPLDKNAIITQVSRTQGTANVGVFAFENGGTNASFVFSADPAKNLTGPFVTLTDSVFQNGDSPVMAYDSVTNSAVLSASTGAVGGPPPKVAVADLTKGTVTEFTGVGAGFVNGIAVDSADGVACTTTELDVNVEFYNLAAKTGFVIRLPNATNQIQSGADVEFDAVHKWFFVAQPVSSTASGSSIYVFDPQGNLIETLDGFNFSNASTVIPVHIALNPGNRTGYVDGPDGTQLQSFTY